MGYYIVLEANSNVTTGMGGSEGTITFANGLTFNALTATGQDIDFGNGQCINYPAWSSSSNYTLEYVCNFIYGSDLNNLPQTVIELRNATTLYIDVTKICTVTVTGNITVTTPGSNQILQHIELTNTGNGFLYGTYNEQMPFPMSGDPGVTLAPGENEPQPVTTIPSQTGNATSLSP